MASQTIKAILAALAVQIAADVSALKLVVDEVKSSNQIAAGEYPACIIQEVGA